MANAQRDRKNYYESETYFKGRAYTRFGEGKKKKKGVANLRKLFSQNEMEGSATPKDALQEYEEEMALERMGTRSSFSDD